MEQNGHGPMDSNLEKKDGDTCDGRMEAQQAAFERITRRAALRKMGVSTFQGFALALAPGALLTRPAKAAADPATHVEAISSSSGSSSKSSSFASVTVTLTAGAPVGVPSQSCAPDKITATAGREFGQAAPDPATWNAVWSWSILSQQYSPTARGNTWGPSGAALTLTPDRANDTTGVADAELGAEFPEPGYYKIHLAASVTYVRATNNAITHGPYVGNVFLGNASPSSSATSSGSLEALLASSSSTPGRCSSKAGGGGSSCSLGSLGPMSSSQAGASFASDGSWWPSSAYLSSSSTSPEPSASFGSFIYL